MTDSIFSNYLTYIPAICVIGYGLYPKIHDYLFYQPEEKKMYSNKHIWIKNSGKKIYDVGVSDFVRKKYSSFTIIKFNDKDKFKKGEKMATLVSPSVEFPIIAPINCTLVKKYDEINQNMIKFSTSFEDTPILCVYVSNKYKDELDKLLSTTDYEAKYLNETGTAINY